MTDKPAPTREEMEAERHRLRTTSEVASGVTIGAVRWFAGLMRRRKGVDRIADQMLAERDEVLRRLREAGD